ncbi:hypothetical protein C1645_819245 [Glomus cerebriforme]|uniref:Uncharacterized protein n=1 Tax=Glomus cerebriforme TaxID=658196 RepID=A0A397TEW0_9GLOM|nr:hypothetical protein C1645_819245 [Glomus cerebriforme]
MSVEDIQNYWLGYLTTKDSLEDKTVSIILQKSIQSKIKDYYKNRELSPNKAVIIDDNDDNNNDDIPEEEPVVGYF